MRKSCSQACAGLSGSVSESSRRGRRHCQESAESVSESTLPSWVIIEDACTSTIDIEGRPCAPATDRHPVRCCGDATSGTCFGGWSVCDSSKLPPITAGLNPHRATLQEANDECEAQGLRLCTADELQVTPPSCTSTHGAATAYASG